MSFKKNKYTVLKNVISKDVADMAYSYFLNKRKVAEFYLMKDTYRPLQIILVYGMMNKYQILILIMPI